MNAPNFLTIIRILLTPILVVFLINDLEIAFIIGLIIAGATDFFDGFVARKFNRETRLGAELDSAADKFFIISLFITIAVIYRINLVILALIFFREFIVITGKILIYAKKNKAEIKELISVTYLSKITTAVHIITMFAIIFNIYPWFFIFASAVLSLTSGIQYFFIGSKFIFVKNLK